MAETSEDAVDILFEGTKYFGNTKTLFHIALVEHTSHNIIEVVSYDKRHSVEAPSLYLIYSALLLRIDGDAVSERILELREEAEECEMVVDESKIVKIAVGEALFDFLAMRLTASATAPNRAKLEFKMMRKDSVSMSAPNPVCNKPETLQPFTYASTLISEGKGLSPEDKWSTPVMLARVAKIRSMRSLKGGDKVLEEYGSLLVENDAETIGSAFFSTVTMGNSDADSVGGYSQTSKLQQWTLSQRPFLGLVENTHGFVEDEDSEPLQPLSLQSKSSFSAGYDAIISSLQRGLSVMHSTSIKSTAVATGAPDGFDSSRPSSAKLFTTASLGSCDSVASFESEGSRKIASRQGPSNHGTTMMSRAFSRRMMELAREAAASAKDDAQPEVDPLAGLSPCDRANRELRAARYMAKLAANAALASQNSSFRTDLYVDTAAGTRVSTPRKDVPSSPSLRLQQAAESLKNGVTGLMSPVMRLFEAATRRGSVAAVAAEG